MILTVLRYSSGRDNLLWITVFAIIKMKPSRIG
jgi:hypothetical protein